ncbi:hypothetical protein [Planktotalea sp.]|uniref:hypothetical protein n=1 Tax=Planktotalea sp. TaxID=2029877 RepID=UPI00329A5D2C
MKNATDERDAFGTMASLVLPSHLEGSTADNSYIVDDLETAWAYDLSVLNLIGRDYPQTHLAKVSELLLIEVFALGCMAQAKQEAGEDITKLERFSEQLGALSRKVNQARQGYFVLQQAASNAIEIEQMTYRQLERYAEYIELEIDLNGSGEFADLWTTAAKLAATLNAASADAADSCLGQFLGTPRVRNSLVWGQSQLVRKTDAAGDFVTLGEGDIADKLLHALLQEDDVAKNFVTPRILALQLGGGWPFEDQENLNPSGVSQLAENLRAHGLLTIEDAQIKAQTLDTHLQTLSNNRSVDFDLIGAKIPYSSAWVLLLANTLILVFVFRLRQRFENIALKLQTDPEALEATLETLQYPLRSNGKADYWLWQLHHDTLGLFGLAIVTCAVYAQTAGLSMTIALLAYAIFAAITMRFWSEKP